MFTRPGDVLALKTIWIFINYYLHLCMYLPSVVRFCAFFAAAASPAIKAKINANAQSEIFYHNRQSGRNSVSALSAPSKGCNIIKQTITHICQRGYPQAHAKRKAFTVAYF